VFLVNSEWLCESAGGWVDSCVGVVGWWVDGWVGGFLDE